MEPIAMIVLLEWLMFFLDKILLVLPYNKVKDSTSEYAFCLDYFAMININIKYISLHKQTNTYTHHLYSPINNG